MTDLIQNVCNYLENKAYKKYIEGKCGNCAKFVRQAVEYGLNKSVKNCLSAKDYGPSYEAIGFKKVFSYPESPIEQYQPQRGDICIIQPYKDIVKGEEVIKQPHGHICFFTGKNWISDFIQGTGGSKKPLAAMYGGPARDKNPSFTIYRYESNRG